MRKITVLFLSTIVFTSVLFSQVPTSPILVEPPKEASVVSLTPTLTWDAVPGASCYFIYITDDTTLSLPSPICMKTTTSYEVPANTLLPDVVYYWTVAARNTEGWSPFSTYFSFHTADNTVTGSITNLMNHVNSLSASGDIANNQANILNNRLEQAVFHLENDRKFVAILNLALFKMRVNILRASDMLTASDAAALIYSADGVIDLIQTLGPQGYVEKEIKPSREFLLQQNYPNPFNPITAIEYSIPDNSFVTVKIYDVRGKEVANLVNKYQQYGSYIVTWDASGLSSGIYIYKLTAGQFTASKKMILTK